MGELPRMVEESGAMAHLARFGPRVLCDEGCCFCLLREVRQGIFSDASSPHGTGLYVGRWFGNGFWGTRECWFHFRLSTARWRGF